MCSMPVNRIPRDYRREPTILDSQTVHAFVRELLDYANDNQTWGVEVAEALVDLIATRLSDTHSYLEPALAHEVLSGIRANWSSEPLTYVDALCTILANLGDTRSFLRERMAGDSSPEIRTLLAQTVAELDLAFPDDDSTARGSELSG
jgi:hypothetical protein